MHRYYYVLNMFTITYIVKSDSSNNSQVNSMFEKFADFIMKHSKGIILAWILLLLLSAYPALKSSEVMTYDMNDMADEDMESIRGLVIIGDDFLKDDSIPDVANMQILVLRYHSEEEKAATGVFVDYLSTNLDNYSWDTKPSMIMDASGYIDVEEGIRLAGIVYTGIEDMDVIAGTEELRDYISSSKSSFVSDYKGFDAILTGTPAIAYDMEHNSSEDIARIDPFTIGLILILVGLFFRSFITSATPPVTIGFAFVVSMALIFGIGQFLKVFYITEMMILVAMMGAGCDYCIFIIARYREELIQGRSHSEALRSSITWAGESILISGMAVIIGFGSMSICGYAMVSTMGICLSVGILIALLAALTLIPSILNLVGERIFWPSKISKFMEGSPTHRGWHAWFERLGRKYFSWSAKFSIKHAGIIVLAAVVVTVPAAYITVNSETSYDMISSMQSGDSGEGMDLLEEYANLGILMPNYVVLEYEDPIAYVGYIPMPDGSLQGTMMWTSSFVSSQAAGLAAYIEQLRHADDNVADVSGIIMWNQTIDALKATGMDNEQAVEYLCDQNVYVNQLVQMFLAMGRSYDDIAEGSGPIFDYELNCHLGKMVGGDFATREIVAGELYYATYVKVTMSTHASAMAPESMETIGKMQDITDEFVNGNPSIEAKWVTGTAVVMYEVSTEFQEQFKVIEILAVALILVLLFFVMKSYLIPIRSVITILMSISWTLAITHILFVEILGSTVIWIVPLILLVICLGLGMDYDILLTTRIKEYVSKGMDNDEAIYGAVTHTGSVITICGLIMGGAFGTLMISDMEMMKEFGFALCFAILVDALVVRTYIVPAVMHLLGNAAWWGPANLKDPSLIDRKFTAKVGTIMAIVTIVASVAAFLVCGEPFDCVTLDQIASFSETSGALMKVAFGLGGVGVFAFGALMVGTNRDWIVKISGILYAVSGIAMLVASLATIEGANPDAVWAASFVPALIASAIYAGAAMKKGRGVAPGLVFLALFTFGACAAFDVMAASFGLMIAAVLSYLFVALSEFSKVE